MQAFTILRRVFTERILEVFRVEDNREHETQDILSAEAAQTAMGVKRRKTRTQLAKLESSISQFKAHPRHRRSPRLSVLEQKARDLRIRLDRATLLRGSGRMTDGSFVDPTRLLTP